MLGFPENGPYDVQPARLGQTATVITQDSYGRGPVQRTITSLRGLVRHGNSGGPVVDGSGRVVATVFAAATSRGRTGYAVPDSIVRERARPRARRGRHRAPARARASPSTASRSSERVVDQLLRVAAELGEVALGRVVEVVARERELHLEAPVALGGRARASSW